MVQNNSHPAPLDLTQTLAHRFHGTVLVDAWGETSLFYNPGNRLPRGVYFATVKSKDGDNDKASHLYRDGIFRLNIGTSKPLFFERFGPPPARPTKGMAIDGDWDFQTLNQLTPHPVYGWMSWVSILNPSDASLADIEPSLQAGYDKAVAAFNKRIAKL